MALTRRQLTALGIEPDKIEEIISSHAETVSGLKEEAEKYRADAEKLASVQKELDDLRKATSGKNYDQLKKEFDEYKASVQAKETRAAKEAAYRDVLKDSNLSEKGIAKAIKYADWDSVELDENGKVKDAKGHLKAVRDEWAEYIVKTTTTGASTTTPPSNTGGTGKTKEEIMGIADTTERQRAIAENHELFGF